jgi:hypothetical protein
VAQGDVSDLVAEYPSQRSHEQIIAVDAVLVSGLRLWWRQAVNPVGLTVGRHIIGPELHRGRHKTKTDLKLGAWCDFKALVALANAIMHSRCKACKALATGPERGDAIPRDADNFLFRQCGKFGFQTRSEGVLMNLKSDAPRCRASIIDGVPKAITDGGLELLKYQLASHGCALIASRRDICANVRRKCYSSYFRKRDRTKNCETNQR